MQLLYSRASPCPEFASLSLLLKSDISGDRVSCRMGEPLVLPSGISTISHVDCVKALKELHHYINSVYKANRTSTSSESGDSHRMSIECFKEDEKLFSEMQVYRPLNGHGLGLHYRLVRDRSTMSKLIPLVFNTGKSTARSSDKGGGGGSSATAAIEQQVTGVILCVGIAGLPSTLGGMSTLHYGLPQRMKDCLDILSTTGTDDTTASRALLTTLLLTEDEDRLNNTMAEGADRTLLLEPEDFGGDRKGLGLRKKNQESKSSGGIETASDPLLLHSADSARIMVERLAVLSVSESDTVFRKYEARAAAVGAAAGGDKAGKRARGRKVARDADLDGFDYKGGPRRTSGSNKVIPKPGSTGGMASSFHSGVGSISSGKSGKDTSKVQLRRPGKDTTSRISDKAASRQISTPLLKSSKKDSRGSSRRASMDHSGGFRPARGGQQQQGNRRASSSSNGQDTMTSDWTFGSGGGDGFSGTNSLEHSGSHLNMVDERSMSSNRTGGSGSRNSRNTRQSGTSSGFDPFFGGGGTDTSTTITESSVSSSRRRGSAGGGFDPHDIDYHPDDGSALSFGNQFADDEMMSAGGRSSRSLGNGSVSGTPRVQVNVALNEDLTCFYKLSKMSSCSVEGVIQVQVKSTAPQGVPFFLLLRDPSKHIQSLQENKKFVDNMAETLAHNPDEDKPDHQFSVSVPKADNYFPVMRYKCGSELRPVPIRVQTRVRLEDDHWRVALQISSNPHNEDNLTDLTIIMGVPPVVKGETLTTSPPGGVWNASKRSVIWCVSELGGGEKFQLQARFEIERGEQPDTNEKPKFPVLVRCQCMYAQLSDVEVEVCDIPEVFPADVRMKLARRFRLSHRERP